MLRKRRREERSDPSAMRQTQAPLGERDEADMCTAIARIKIEWYMRREQSRLNEKMHEERVAPVGQEERFCHDLPLQNSRERSSTSAPRSPARRRGVQEFRSL